MLGVNLQRDNFQMEGPVRVMKQLEAMSSILEVTDADMLKHLVLVGADNFLFAFRMLLVLFRRELSIAEALYMWEVRTTHLLRHFISRLLIQDLRYVGILLRYLKPHLGVKQWGMYVSYPSTLATNPRVLGRFLAPNWLCSIVTIKSVFWKKLVCRTITILSYD